MTHTNTRGNNVGKDGDHGDGAAGTLYQYYLYRQYRGLIGFADSLAACSVHAVEYDQIVFEKEEADFVSRAK